MRKVNIYPVLATWKKETPAGFPLHISIDLDNKRAAFPSLKRRVKLEHWDQSTRLLRSSAPNAVMINALIRNRTRSFDEELTRRQLLGIPITRQFVKTLADGRDTQDFYRFCRERISIGNYSANTRRVYTHELSKLEKFATVLSFQDLDYDFFSRYDNYMRSSLKNLPNTVWKSFKFLNTMLNLAVKIGGYIASNPLDDYDKQAYRQTIPNYLEWSDVLKLKEQLISNQGISPSTRLIGYYFFLSCVSGLRFSDAIRFDYESFVITGKDKRQRLILSTQKTGEIVSISFTQEIAWVVDILKEKKLSVTNQEFNRCLKLLGASASLSKPLTSHMGRHTFAMRCAELGMREEDVQKLLGHSDISTTRIYFKVKNPRLDDAMRAWDKK